MEKDVGYIEFHLKEVLDAKGISIQGLSRRTGERFETLRRICNGTIVRIPVSTLIILCSTLNVGIDDIMTYKERR